MITLNNEASMYTCLHMTNSIDRKKKNQKGLKGHYVVLGNKLIFIYIYIYTNSERFFFPSLNKQASLKGKKGGRVRYI